MAWNNKTKAEKKAAKDARARAMRECEQGVRYDAHFVPDGGYMVHTHAPKYSARWAIMGVEIETQPLRNGQYNAMLRSGGNYYANGIFPCYDGSLGRDGIEWKTDAGTLPWLFSTVSTLYANMERCGYTANYDGGYAWNCGLHIHIAKSTFGVTEYAWQNAAYKMAVVIDRFVDWFEEMAGRNFQEWAPSGNIRYIARVGERSVNDLPVRNAQADMQAYFDCTKYAAVNVAHEDTIELRIGAGRASEYAVKQYLVRVNALVNLVKERKLSTVWFEECTLDEFVAVFYEKENEVLNMVAGL